MAYEWVKLWLKADGKKQADLARHLDIGTDMMSKVFSGVRSLEAQQLLKTAEFFNVSVEEVLTGRKSIKKDDELNQLDVGGKMG